MSRILSVEQMAMEMSDYKDTAVEIAVYVWRYPLNELEFKFQNSFECLFFRDELLFATKVLAIGGEAHVACGGPAGEIIMMGKRYHAEKATRTIH